MTGQVVVDDTGEPIEGATVTAGRDFEPGEFEDRDWGSGISKDTTTDADGRFTLKGLRDRPHNVSVLHPRWIAKRRESVGVPSAQPLIIRLERGRTVSGEVLDHDGRPAAGAEIRVRGKYEDGEMFYTSTHADTVGQFVLGGLPADTVLCVVAKGEDWHVCYGLRALKADENRVAFDARELVEVSGSVIDPKSGQPVPIRVSCTAYAMAPGGAALHLCAAVPLDEVGRFRILLPPNGDIALQLHADDDVFGSPFMNQLDLAMRDGKPDRSLDVPAAKPWTLTVRVVDATTDQPVAGAGVDLSTAPDHWGLGYPDRTDTDGRATWDCLPPCDLKMDVVAASYESVKDRHILMPADEEVVVRLTPKD